MRRSKGSLLTILTVLVGLFLLVALDLTYFEFFKAEKLRNHPQNMRNWVDESLFGRGRFLDRNGFAVVIREKKEDGSFTRYSNSPRMYAHIIGYNSKIYGKTGLEKTLNNDLLNLSNDNPIAALRGQVLQEGVGNDIMLTIDQNLQYQAYLAMADHKGACIAMNPKTGEIYCDISTPSFDTNHLEENWDQLTQSEDAVLFNRAHLGLYPPGSTMKAISAISVLEAGQETTLEDRGMTEINGYKIHNYEDNAYGRLDMRGALVHSSNVYFAEVSQKVSPDIFHKTVNSFYFNRQIPFDMGTAISRAHFAPGMDKTLLAANAFGQGKILATPLNMLMAYSAIGNGGKMMKPYLVKSVLSPQGTPVRSQSPVQLSAINPDYAKIVSDYLHSAARENGVENRTGGISVAGKSGTAEVQGKKTTDAWYICYGPAKDPDFAICVLLEEDGGTGMDHAMPIAASLMNFWFSNHQ